MKKVRMALWALVALAAIVLVVRYYTATGTISPAVGPGGPFELTSHEGKRVKNTDFSGRYMLIYFGYSFCPDVCPLDLQKLSAALYILEEQGYDTKPLQPLFISIDPERDTPEELAQFVPDFHPRLIGLTGTVEEIRDVARAYKVYYAKREQPGTDAYLMDHQALIFAMGPDGEFIRIFGSSSKPDDMAAALAQVLEKP